MSWHGMPFYRTNSTIGWSLIYSNYRRTSLNRPRYHIELPPRFWTTASSQHQLLNCWIRVTKRKIYPHTTNPNPPTALTHPTPNSTATPKSSTQPNANPSTQSIATHPIKKPVVPAPQIRCHSLTRNILSARTASNTNLLPRCPWPRLICAVRSVFYMHQNKTSLFPTMCLQNWMHI